MKFECEDELPATPLIPRGCRFITRVKAARKGGFFLALDGREFARILYEGMKFGVVINQHTERGRDEAIAEEIRTGFADEGSEALVRLSPSKELEVTARALLQQNVGAIIAGGGDGTVSTLAEICVREGMPLGVLPLGTRNHFGRDMELPRDTRGSIRCIAAGKTRRIDAGSVNGRIFINNSSIGAYPRAVEQRDELRLRFGLRKHVAGMIATLRIFSQRPLVDAVVELDGRTERHTGPFVFVGNNVYSVKLFSVNLRSSLSEGKLCVYTTRGNGVSGLLRLLWLSLWNRLEPSRDFEMRCGTEVVIRLRKATVRVSKDGEVLRMKTPLHYKIQPGALEVFVP
ncbi:MAG: diacylglycerol/lipid kinase family protein [Limisphaerales bacterium]